MGADNWIGGEWRPAAGGAEWELDGARWPRSGEADVALALLAARGALGPWRALGAAARAAALAPRVRAIAEDPDPEGALAARLGLSPDELAPHLAGVVALAAELEAGEVPRRPGEAPRSDGEPRGAMVFAPHWSELVSEPLRALCAALVRGRPVVWVADPRAPAIARRAVRALASAGLPPGALALLHDDGESALRAALGAHEVDAVDASGPAARMRRLERMVQRLRKAEPAPPRAFGAGIDEPAPALSLRVLRNASLHVGLDDDPAELAREAVERAFGRSAALSGQLPGQVGRVLCHQRLLSRFTEHLLALLDAGAPGEPIEPLEPQAALHLRRATALGLDEGATPIFGLERIVAGDGASDDEPPEPRPRERRGTGALAPVVFTNVEEHMRLAWLGRPAPLLCLLRVESEAEGRALAARLDQDPLAEDLSAVQESGP